MARTSRAETLAIHAAQAARASAPKIEPSDRRPAQNWHNAYAVACHDRTAARRLASGFYGPERETRGPGFATGARPYSGAYASKPLADRRPNAFAKNPDRDGRGNVAFADVADVTRKGEFVPRPATIKAAKAPKPVHQGYAPRAL